MRPAAEFSASSYQWNKTQKGKRFPPHETARSVGLADSAQRVLLDLELWGAEVNQQAMLNARCAQVAKDLGRMLLLMSSTIDSSVLRHLRLLAAERLSPLVPLSGKGLQNPQAAQKID